MDSSKTKNILASSKARIWISIWLCLYIPWFCSNKPTDVYLNSVCLPSKGRIKKIAVYWLLVQTCFHWIQMQDVKIKSRFTELWLVYLKTPHETEKIFCTQAGTWLKHQPEHSVSISNSLECCDTQWMWKCRFKWFETGDSAPQTFSQILCAKHLEKLCRKE